MSPTRIPIGLALLLAPWAASADTNVPAGNLVGGTQTWTAAASPYVLSGDVTIPAGTTLTLQAGTVVRFSTGDGLVSGEDTARTELRVSGALVSSGTQGNPVRFISGAATPATGDYYGIVGLSGGSISLASTEISHGLVCVRDKGANAQITQSAIRTCQTAVRVEAGTPNLSTSELSGNSTYGLWASSGAQVTASGLNIFNNQNHGVFVDSASLDLRNSILRGNSSGVYLSTSGSAGLATLAHNTIYGNTSRGVYIYRGSGTTLSVTVQDSVIVHNGSYGIYASNGPSVTTHHNLVYDHATDYSGVSAGPGSISENALLANAPAADFRPTHRSGARFSASDGTDMGAIPHDPAALTPGWTGHLFTDVTFTSGQTYIITGDLTVEPDVILTIEPGASVLFSAGQDVMDANDDRTRIELRVRGTLIADGTASQRIRFSSTSPSAAAGDWHGIRLLPESSASIIDYATIEYGKYGVHSGAPAGTIIQRTTIQEHSQYGVYATDNSAVRLSQLVIKNNDSAGVFVSDADPIIEKCTIIDNAARGIYATTSGGSHSVEASHNTIGGHTNAAIYVYRGSGTTLNVTARDNILVNNGYGLYASNGPSVTSTYNLAWGNSTDYSGVSAGLGSISENPLFVSWASRDLRPTSSSPSRLHASDGTDMGSLAYDGVITPTIQGHIYADTTWTGSVDVLGDVTVEPGVTLTLSGAQVRFAAGDDDQAANQDINRTELRVLGRLVIDGSPGNPVRLGSNAVTPAPGDWYGVHLTSSAANTALEHLEITHAYYGIRSSAPISARVEMTQISDSASYGLFVDGGAATFDGVSVARSGAYGAYVSDASPLLVNFVAWSCASGGMYLATSAGAGTVVVDHATLWGNSGRGIYIYRGSGTTLNATVKNSIIADNGSYGIYASNGPSVTLSYNDVAGQSTNYSGVSAGPNSVSATPQFVSTVLGNFHLLPNSPAIDAADPASAVNHDAEGLLRPLDGDLNTVARADMGAFEYNPSANRWPNADAGPDRIAHDGISVTFDATGSADPDGTIASYAWDFGDGSPVATGAVVAHTFTGGTDRVVSLTVTDNAGAIDVDTVNVEVNLRPTAEAGPTRFADPGEIVTFSASGSTDSDGTIASYRWDFGDGQFGSGSNVTHIYAAGGDFNVVLTVTDDDGATGTDTTTARITGGVDTSAPVIIHTPVANAQTSGQSVVVTAQISDASGVGSATLFYRRQGTGNFTPAPMSLVSGSTYQATIPANTVVAPAVEYYLHAVDSAPTPNAALVPSGAPTTTLTFTVSPAPGPVITHTPMADGRPAGVDVVITAQVSSASPLSSVVVEYRRTGVTNFTTLNMTGTNGTYTAVLPGAQIASPSVEYRIRATDDLARATTAPIDGSVYTFTVAGPDDTVPPTISHTPPSGTLPAGQAFSVVATVTDSSGLASVTLHYRVSGSGGFGTFSMSGSGNSYSAVIPGGSIAAPGIEYWIEAIDASSAANRGVAPSTAPTTPYAVPVETVLEIAPGDLIVTEIMSNPTGSETQREWFEVYNTSNHPIDMVGLEIADGGTDAFTITSPSAVVIQPGAYFVFGRNADSNLNGGVSVQYVYSGFFLSNASDEIIIRAGATLVDAVAYDDGTTFPDVEGHTMSLEPGSLDSGSNDDGVSWCAASTALSGGDFGTPGAENDGCGPGPDTSAPVIVHTPIADGQLVGSGVVVSAQVTDDVGVASVELFYRATGTTTFSSVPMSGTQGTYQATIPQANVTAAGVDYYITAQDGAGNAASSPATAPTIVHDFTTSTTDVAGPSIVHAPVGNQAEGTNVVISAQVSDPSGVDVVTLHFRSGSGAFTGVAMVQGAGDTYTASIQSVVRPSVDYYVEAVDGIGNVRTYPEEGADNPLSFAVSADDNQGPTIVHTPIVTLTVGQSATLVATITDPSGVAEVRAYYRRSGEAAFQSQGMTPGNQGSWSTTLPAQTEAGSVDYYLEAVDDSDAQNVTRDPANAPGSVHTFAVVAENQDMEGPAIDHVPPAEAVAGSPVVLEATVTDPSGVESAFIHYREKGATEFAVVPMAATGELYRAMIPGEDVVENGLEYWIEATDTLGNASHRPLAAPTQLYALKPDPAPETVDPERDRGGCECSTHGPARSPLLGLCVLLLLVARRRRARLG